ncbi:fumarate reductase/succinate dehydrogenase flavoprotein domain protein (plasmid) [Allomeiothermus silvanus DSM 9946]|uniref:Fumarate reductase/succinate dehydrogenase flavoprotein domain protein n=1 Tax=Allomeiothermus silvanus (strain ATCC 700542 / DSM 9946 / NBRC 106475 / NCIMB 13440 / VI-R2) TaxID=526227 RepID=D7BJ48_ALLS1|nr:carbohydrate ABC transporter permease [Allomeiothermus silvanus]ADH65204.1 fumarate reductase/succinate dehydrogenase flavoprotein domain protein [Allomeiothermus silvanus DSM 9946]
MRTNLYWHLLLVAILLLVSVPFVVPIAWMFLSSFKTGAEIFSNPFQIEFAKLSLDNFREIFVKYPFAHQYLNSLYILAIVIPITTLLSALAGYAFARLRFWGRDVLFILTLGAMMIPSELTAVPQFVLFKNLGAINTHLPVILLQIFSATGALAVFLMRQHFITLPKELEEAGRVDGLSHWGVYWYIMLPLSRPALVTVAIFAMLNSWNDYFNPLIYLNSEPKLTLPLALQRFTDPLGGVFWNLTLAGSTLVAIPILLLFLLAQRQFVASLASSGMKG